MYEEKHEYVAEEIDAERISRYNRHDSGEYNRRYQRKGVKSDNSRVQKVARRIYIIAVILTRLAAAVCDAGPKLSQTATIFIAEAKTSIAGVPENIKNGIKTPSAMIAVIILVRIYRLGGGQPLSLLIPSESLGLRQVPADAPAHCRLPTRHSLYAQGGVPNTEKLFGRSISSLPAFVVGYNFVHFSLAEIGPKACL